MRVELTDVVRVELRPANVIAAIRGLGRGAPAADRPQQRNATTFDMRMEAELEGDRGKLPITGGARIILRPVEVAGAVVATDLVVRMRLELRDSDVESFLTGELSGAAADMADAIQDESRRQARREGRAVA